MPGTPKRLEPVAVVATTYARERLQGTLALLDGLRRQAVPLARLIFVVQRDLVLVDPIRAAVTEAPFPAEVLFRPDIDGLAAARNAALLHLSEPIVAFIDDDAVPAATWIEEIQRAFRMHNVVGVTGPADPIWSDGLIDWVPTSTYWLFSCTGGEGWDREFEVRNAWGSNMAFRTDAIRAVGGFDPSAGLLRGGRHIGVPEDVDLSLRIRSLTGLPILFMPRIRIGHRVERWRFAAGFVLRRAAWIAAVDRVARRRYPELSASAAHGTVRRQMTRQAASDLFTWPLHPLRNSQRLRLYSLIGLGVLRGWLLPATMFNSGDMQP